MKNNRNATRQLLGIDRITDYALSTPMGDLAFFIVKPTNIGVLPESSIAERVQALVNVIRTEGDIELMALNSWESFQSNKIYYRDRMAQETLPAVREMLERDCEHLDEMQGKLSTAREFYFVVRIPRGEKETDLSQYLSDIEQRITDFGYKACCAGRQELMRMFSIYYAQNVTSEVLQEYDGEYWLGKRQPKKAEKKKKDRRSKPREAEKDFLDMIAPTVIKFFSF